MGVVDSSADLPKSFQCLASNHVDRSHDDCIGRDQLDDDATGQLFAQRDEEFYVLSNVDARWLLRHGKLLRRSTYRRRVEAILER